MKKELLPIIFLVGILAIGCKNDHDSPNSLRLIHLR